MSWRDRDYSRVRSGSGAGARPRGATPLGGTSTVTVVLLAAHVTAIVAGLMTGGGPGSSSISAPPLAGGRLDPWAVVLHPFASTDPLTAGVVLAGLGMLAMRLERAIGGGRLLWMYVGGNLLAGLAYWTLARGSPALAVVSLRAPVGALTALALAACRLHEFSVPGFAGVRHRPLLIACLATAVLLAAFEAGAGSTAWVAAVAAGGAVGALATPFAGLRPRARPRRGARVRNAQSVATPARDAPACSPTAAPTSAGEVDAILAKISREGIGSLTTEERARLEAARRALLHAER